MCISYNTQFCSGCVKCANYCNTSASQRLTRLIIDICIREMAGVMYAGITIRNIGTAGMYRVFLPRLSKSKIGRHELIRLSEKLCPRVCNLYCIIDFYQNFFRLIERV